MPEPKSNPRTELHDSIPKWLWYLFCRTLSVGIVSLLYRVKVYNRSAVPKQGPVLVVSNHQSFFDPMFSQNWIWRPFYFVPRDTLLDVKFWGWVIRKLYVISIRRGQADIAAIKTIIEVLKQDKAVCLFLEGTRTPDGKIGVIKPGFGLISRRSGATIVPVIIDGIFEAWPRTQKYPKLFGKVAVMYGDPISPEHIKTLSDEQFADELTRRMREIQADLRGRLNKKPYTYDSQ